MVEPNSSIQPFKAQLKQKAKSASAIEAMLRREPIIVTDTGFHREAANGQFVSAANELADI